MNKADSYPFEVIGTGTGLINPNSEDFQALREKIAALQEQKSEAEKRHNQILGLIYRMDSYLQEEASDEIIPVGVFLKQLVQLIGVTHKAFADYIGYNSANLSALYSGKGRLNHDLALKLGHIFEMNPAFWLNLQNKAELLQLARENGSKYEQYQLSDLLKKAD